MKAATPANTHGILSASISIHAAREGGDAPEPSFCTKKAAFQSTPPVKAATMSVGYAVNWDVFQSTPPVKAATEAGVQLFVSLIISIHAAREGGDDDIGATMADSSVFQSTPPVKAATHTLTFARSFRVFQSTPPVKAATLPLARYIRDAPNFNPRRP